MIPFFDYRHEYRRYSGEIDAAIRRVIDSGRLILGPEVEAFESEFARRLGTDHAVGVASGTDALILALRSLEIGSGAEVITVSNAGVPPVAAVRAVGATPRLVDVDDATLLLDPAKLDDAHGPRTRAVLVVHLYGRPAPLGAIGAFTERHGLDLIEDCAQAAGTTFDGRPVGTLGSIGCFSFYPTKNLGAYGDGGLCVTARSDLAERLRAQRMYGFRPGGRSAAQEGLNSRLDELQAAILRVKLRHLDDSLAERRRLARLYNEAFSGSGVSPVGPTVHGESTHHLFVVRTADRTTTIHRLDRAGIGHGIHYAEPVHTMEAYRTLALAAGPLVVSEAACRSVLSLPLYPGLSTNDVERVASALLA